MMKTNDNNELHIPASRLGFIYRDIDLIKSRMERLRGFYRDGRFDLMDGYLAECSVAINDISLMLEALDGGEIGF